MEKLSIAILLTSFNRKEKTKKCLETLGVNEHKDCDVFWVNDGCTDGTEKMIQSLFPKVNILNGDGTLFWNRGMHLAFSTAIKKKYEFYLWVNDDVVFEKSIIDKLISSYYQLKHDNNKVIIAGYTLDEEKKEITYCGYNRKKNIIPLALRMVNPSNDYERCDTFNGNCVLIPNEVVELIGINSDFYNHGFGDIDYGLTASNNGIQIYVTNYHVGYCEKNISSQIWNDIKSKATIKQKYKVMTSTTHKPNKEWMHFTKKFGGPFWILRFISPYLKLIISPIVRIVYK